MMIIELVLKICSNSHSVAKPISKWILLFVLREME